MAGLGDIIRSLSAIVPLRTLAILVMVLAVLALPSWLETIKERQIRGTVRRMVRADPAERGSLADRALLLAAGKPRRLSVLTGEAIRYDQRAVRDRALAALEAAGGDAVKLRERIERPRTRFRDPVEAAVRIETTLRDGLVEAAREQLADARAAFPVDPDLAALASRIEIADKKS